MPILGLTLAFGLGPTPERLPETPVAPVSATTRPAGVDPDLTGTTAVRAPVRAVTTIATPPVPEAIPVAVANDPRCGEPVESMIRAAFPEDPDRAVSVAVGESLCFPWVTGPDGHDQGVFQLRHPYWAADYAAVGCADPYDAACNIAAARRGYERSGWACWSYPYSGCR